MGGCRAADPKIKFKKEHVDTIIPTDLRALLFSQIQPPESAEDKNTNILKNSSI
jgi:hypothetical protein